MPLPGIIIVLCCVCACVYQFIHVIEENPYYHDVRISPTKAIAPLIDRRHFRSAPPNLASVHSWTWQPTVTTFVWIAKSSFLNPIMIHVIYLWLTVLQIQMEWCYSYVMITGYSGKDAHFASPNTSRQFSANGNQPQDSVIVTCWKSEGVKEEVRKKGWTLAWLGWETQTVLG